MWEQKSSREQTSRNKSPGIKSPGNESPSAPKSGQQLDRMTGNGQLTRGAFRINDLLRNPYFNNAYDVNKIRPFIYKK